MLPHPITHQLRTLKLDGMAQAIQEQQEQPQARELSFEERLTLLAIANRGAESLIGLKDNQKTAFAYAKAQLAAAPPLFAVVASAAGAGLKCAP